MTVEFFYDFVSPYTYLASTRVEEVAARAGATVRFRPFLLGAVLKAAGNHAPFECAPKFRHLQQDVSRWARRLGVPLRFPPAFPFSTVLALRCALAAEREGRLVPFTHAAFRAAWAEARDLTSADVLAQIAASAGLDGKAIVAAAPEHKGTLTAQTEEAIRRGAFGAPTFFVGDELFVGNDRLDFVEEALRSVR